MEKLQRKNKSSLVFIAALLVFTLVVYLGSISSSSNSLSPCPDIYKPSTPFLTFIVPSRGRRTLLRALNTIRSQTNPNWKAIVLFDGLDGEEPEVNLPDFILGADQYANDARFLFLNLPFKAAKSNCAGDVRNLGIAMVESPWVSFLDDDDAIASDFVELLMQESKSTGADLVCFRMFSRNSTNADVFLPPIQATEFRLDSVGISFAFKRSLFPSHKFVSSTVEDFEFIHSACSSGHNCVIAPFATYFVHGVIPTDAELINGTASALRIGTRIKNARVHPFDNYELRYRASYCYLSTPAEPSYPFLFTEYTDPLLVPLIGRLKGNLLDAITKGCLHWNLTEDIHIILGEETKPATKTFIQVQMKFTTAFTSAYTEKLTKARQVWALTKDNAVHLHDNMHLDETFVIPPTVFNSDPLPNLDCSAASEIGIAETYSSSGCYAKWQVQGGRGVSVNASPSTCASKKAHCSVARDLAMPDVVLLFGDADPCVMERLCDEGRDAGLNMACLSTLDVIAYKQFVCAAKIIMMDQSSAKTSIEIINYDPILLAQKVIVTTPIPNELLNRYYSKFVVVAALDEMMATTRLIIEDFGKWYAMQELHTKHYVAVRRHSNLQPLCYALESLSQVQ